MVDKESIQLPLSHNRVQLLQCKPDYLETLSAQRRQSMHLLECDGNVYHLHPRAYDEEEKTVNICKSCFVSLAHALRSQKPPIQTFAFYDYGVIPAHLPELTLAEKIATSINIVLQVIINLRPLAGVSQTAAKGHAIAVPLTGVQSLATVVYELPRRDICNHISLVIIAKKGMWKSMKQLLRNKGPLKCNPRKVLITLLHRKAVENKNYSSVSIPT